MEQRNIALLVFFALTPIVSYGMERQSPSDQKELHRRAKISGRVPHLRQTQPAPLQELPNEFLQLVGQWVEEKKLAEEIKVEQVQQPQAPLACQASSAQPKRRGRAPYRTHALPSKTQTIHVPKAQKLTQEEIAINIIEHELTLLGIELAPKPQPRVFRGLLSAFDEVEKKERK